jgi:hypothetical protein
MMVKSMTSLEIKIRGGQRQKQRDIMIKQMHLFAYIVKHNILAII